MAHHPYPNRTRALHQLQRHDAESTTATRYVTNVLRIPLQPWQARILRHTEGRGQRPPT